jgi:CMP-N,N'-diacetyllegionaminic acid synthase
VTVAVVVARGGSVRLPGKALLPFNGTTLIGHKVRQLKACRRVDRVVVNSDSPAIVAAAVAEGAQPIDGRDYGGDTHEMLADTARKCPGETLVWAHPTNPLVSAATYDAAVDAYFAADCDSLLSVYRVQRHAWLNGGPANYNPWSHPHPLARDCLPVFFQDGAIFIQPRERFVETRYFFGDRPALFETPEHEVCDIDHPSDYDSTPSAAHSISAIERDGEGAEGGNVVRRNEEMRL